MAEYYVVYEEVNRAACQADLLLFIHTVFTITIPANVQIDYIVHNVHMYMHTAHRKHPVDPSAIPNI